MVERIFSHFVDNIFMVAAYTAGKGRQIASFVGKIFVFKHKNHEYLPHDNYQLAIR